MRATGLQTYQNNLSEIREGSLEIADNVVINRPGIIEPRRGFKTYGDSFPSVADRAKQLLVYKNRILRHYFDNTSGFNKLQVDNGSGTFTTLSGTFNETESGLRIKSVEANSNLYFTTDKGIKKLSVSSSNDIATATATDAGGVKATDVTAFIDYSTPGFFSPKSKVSYSVTWTITDANDNFIEGSPSSRYVVTNFNTTQSAVNKVYITIPFGVTPNHVYRVYRTAVFEAGLLDINDIDPGTEHQLVIERSYGEAISLGMIVDGRIVETDITPEDFRSGGTYMYTNPVSGEGIENANEPPPLSKDITLFKGVTFYANTVTRHRLEFNLLSVNNILLLGSGNGKLIVSNGIVTREYTFVGESEKTTIDMTGATGATVAGKYFTINSANDEIAYYVWYNTGASTDPMVSGRSGIMVSVLAGDVAATLATKTSIALNNTNDFSSTEVGNTVVNFNVENGDSTDATSGDSGFAVTVNTQGVGEDIATGKILTSALPSVGQAVDATARSIVRVINGDSSSAINAYYLSGLDDVPGDILFENRSSEDVVFFVAVNDTTLSTEFSPTFPVTKAITAISAAPSAVVTSVGHGLVSGNLAVIYGTDSTPVIDGVRKITYLTANTFSISVTTTLVGTTGTFFKGSVFSDNQQSINNIYYSKYQQPEAVPLINFLAVGKRDYPIKRILPLRDSLFIFKTDGLYRLSGVAGNFQVTLFDSNVNIFSPDSAVVLNNQIYLLAQDGVTLVTESGTSIISYDIKNQIDETVRSNHPSTATAAFGMNYDSDHSYLLWVPKETTDTYATQVFRYNFTTNTWTRWLRTDSCAIIPGDNKIYVGLATSNSIEQERKNFNRKDYADKEFPSAVITDGIVNNVVNLTIATNATIGDVVNQVQYLTLFEFNQVISKISTDFLAPIGLRTAVQSLVAVAGNDLRNQVDDLSTLLQAQLGGTYGTLPNGGPTFSDVQEDFNYLVDLLNLDIQIYQTNFMESIGTKSFDYHITTIVSNTVTLTYAPLFISGDVIIVRGISTKIRYTPIHFGDPSILKQVNQGTYIFDNRNSFSSATASYATDLSTGFEPVNFTFPGSGVWGQFIWDDMTWGGERNYAPMRTLLPQQKQRCRFVLVQLEHTNAYETYTLMGISLENRPTSERAYL